MKKKFIEILQQHAPNQEPLDLSSKERAAQIGIGIEEALNSKFSRDLKAYADKARSIVFNLKDPKNPMLRNKLIEGDLTPWDIVTRDSRELASEAKKQERQETQNANLQARRTDWHLEQA